MQQLGKNVLKATIKSPLIFPKKLLLAQYRKRINWPWSTKSLFFVASSVYLISALLLGFFDSVFSNVIFSFSVFVLLLNYNLPLTSDVFNMKKFRVVLANNHGKKRFLLWLILYYNPFILVGVLFFASSVCASFIQGNFIHSIDLFFLFILSIQVLIAEIVMSRRGKAVTTLQLVFFLATTILQMNLIIKYVLYLLLSIIGYLFFRNPNDFYFQKVTKSKNSTSRSVLKTMLYNVIFSDKKQKIFMLVPGVIAPLIAHKLGASFSPAITFILMLLVQYEIVIDNQLEDFEVPLAKIKALKSAKISFFKRFVSTLYFKLSMFTIFIILIANYFYSRNFIEFIIPSIVETIYIPLMSMYYLFFLERELMTRSHINSVLREFLPITIIFTFFIF
ncbi:MULTISPECIES: hypothetical protein [Enterococcus]|uniref:Uncharacterized protein n=1 Tax=bioreactor metagenome TaxID=1076179 RepID=A0A645BEW9_9ZZZZ|nr:MULTISPECIES: hypothetical protein [Enterococcus]MDA3965295.1 hypothetical protein [Enterococcus thailandicus]MDK4353024.1 hypothetical protein [Enterococcus thailandicus]MDT2734602.1 hypothetical protein [Enterococcus thailandicus]MDT2795504.1 hypothetical protein [Enterococcus thailandicus]MDT2847048.1 hypothetical protein [Enterococcus thailandicus]